MIGYPNTGKSSLINVLRNKPLCATGNSPFITRSIQEVKVNSAVVVYDTPSVILAKVSNENSLEAVRSAVQVDEIKNPAIIAEQILAKVGKEELLRHYRIANFESTEQMLQNVAQKKGLIENKKIDNPSGTGKPKKIKVANEADAARRVIRDFLNNRLTYYSKV